MDYEQLQEMADVLINWPADGKPEQSVARNRLFISGLIVETDVKKHCKSCGAPQVDYSYCRITEAGKMFLAAMQSKPNA
jgi:hypothetical protein